MDGIRLCTTHGHEMVFVSLMRTPHSSTAVVRGAMNAVLMRLNCVTIHTLICLYRLVYRNRGWHNCRTD